MQQYQSAGAAGAAHFATPHKLVEMLLAGAMDRLAQAKGGMMRGDTAQKLQGIAKTVAIVEHLRMNLDFQAGGEIARNLGHLYDYMMQRLAAANAGNDVRVVDEVLGLLREIKSAWDAIPPPQQARH